MQLVSCQTKGDVHWVMFMNSVNGLVPFALVMLILWGVVQSYTGSEVLADVVAGAAFLVGAFYWCRYVWRGGLFVKGTLEDVQKLPDK